MRRLLTFVLAAGLALLAASAASATPTVTFSLRAEPIPGFPRTGDILGAGAEAALHFTIEGSEYFGSAPPMIGARFYAPKGAEIHTEGWPTCSEETIVELGPGACPKSTKAGPRGTVLGYVQFGGERVHESGELLPFFKPGGGFEYYAFGHSPVLIEAIAKGEFTHLGGVGGYAFEEEEEIPLIETVPEGPDASVETITGEFGAARKSNGKTIYYFRMPSSCPPGGFPLKVEVIFADEGDPSRPETVTAYSKTPCPRR